MIQRTAIIVKRDLEAGKIGNVCAILMAEVARALPGLMSDAQVSDLDGLMHARPKFSIVILKANGSEQLRNAIAAIRTNQPELTVVGFSEIGQSLNNEFDAYKSKICSSTTEATALIGIAISGDDAAVRIATKKFSVL